MTRYGLIVLVVARLASAQTVPIIAPDGAASPDRVEIEWLGPGGNSLALDTRPVRNRAIVLGTPPPGAEAVRVVGPDVVSLALAWKDRGAGLRLANAGRLRLSGIPKEVAVARVFMELEQSGLEYRREIRTRGAPEIELAVPLGSYAAAIDLGPDRAPVVIAPLAIRNAALTRLEIETPNGKPLNLQVTRREDGQPLAGASISGRPTPELPAVFWHALALRCGLSDPSGRFSCGVVPLPLFEVDVVAPRRRRAHVSMATAGPESEAKQSVKVALARYQDVRIATTFGSDYPERFVKGLTAVLARCGQSGCDDSKAVRKELGPQRAVTFSEIEPGTYRTWLEGALVRSVTRPVAVSDDSGAPDAVAVSLQLNLWHVLGSTRLANAAGVPAKIWLGTFREDERQQELAAVVDSDGSGGYDLFVLAEPGAYLWAHAISEKPPAEGETTPPGVKLVDGDDRILLDIEMSTSGGVVRLVDKETREAVGGCKVAVYHWGPASGGSRFLNSDANGVVHWLGISKGTFVARAMCEGYRPASTEKIDLSDGSEETTLELERAGSVRLHVRDAEGHPLPGALLFLEQSNFENVTYPFQIPAEQLGVTDFNGEILVPARPRPGFYVLAPGHALHVARLAACSTKSGCIQEVRLARLTPFPGIRVRNAASQPVSAAWLVFSKDGVPIPVSIQSEIVRINRADSRSVIIREGPDTVHMLPGLFGPGVYDVGYAQPRSGAPPEVIPAARMALPSSHRIEIELPATQH